MDESFPNSNGVEWSQFGEPNQDRQDSVNKSTEYLKTAPIQDLGQKALESMELETASPKNPADTGEEEASAEGSNEAIPTIDTAESLAERQERLRRGIKIVIGGPPQSGKSVFIEALTQNLVKDSTFSFGAAPDGEGPWLQRHYNDPKVVKFRQKGKYSPEYVAKNDEEISNWKGPLMLIDIGGRIDEYNAQMIKGATHAIVLSNDLSKVAEWRDFFEKNNIEVIAKLHSHHQYDKDIQRPTESGKNYVVSSIHHLERGKPAVDRETIKQVAGLIISMVEGNIAYKQDRGPFEISISEIFKDLPGEIVEHTVIMPDKQERQVRNKVLLRSAIPQIYEEALKYDKQPAWLDGPVNSWESVASAMAFEDAGSTDVRLNSPDGYVQIKNLPETEKIDTKWWEEPQQQGEMDGKPIYVVHNKAHKANNPVSPADLETMTVPQLPENAVAIISTQGPNWLKASIASGYKGKVAGIATFQPGEGSTVVWAANKEDLGKVI